MKTKLLIATGLAILTTSFAAYAECNRDDGSCTCVDPTCRPIVGNGCMSRDRCCNAFGNIAGTNFSADTEENYNAENILFFQDFSYASPRTYKARRSYKGE